MPGRKPAGVAGGEPQNRPDSIPCIWPMYPASDHSKTQEMEHFVKEFANSPAIFITFQAHRNTCTGCSESTPGPPECKTVQRFLQLPNARYPRLQGPIRPLIIHAQAAGNLTRQLSFMHPVHSFASTGHTGDPQDLSSRPLQEITRAYKKSIQEHPRYSKGPRTLIVSWSDSLIVTHYSRALQRQIHLQIHMQIQRRSDRCRYRATDADTEQQMQILATTNH